MKSLSTSSLQPKDETNYLFKLSELKWHCQLAQNPLIKDSLVSDFNKFATDSIKKVRNWLMTVEAINESYLLGFKTYVIRLSAKVNPEDTSSVIRVKDDILNNSTSFEEVLLAKSTSKKAIYLLSILKHLTPGDTVKVTGFPKCNNAKNEVDYSQMADNITLHNISFSIDSIAKK